jgi:hypothetical protein
MIRGFLLEFILHLMRGRGDNFGLYINLKSLSNVPLP